jgi:non-ribosomal peptide synthetase component F
MKNSSSSANNKASWAAANEAGSSCSGQITLSAGQLSLLNMQYNNPLNSAYNEGIAVELGPGTSLERLYKAIVKLMEANTQLATVYGYCDDMPAGSIMPFIPDFEIINFESNDRAALAKAVNAEYNTAFDLSRACMRIRIYRMADNDCVMLIVVHPIACDGWSCRLLWDELVDNYNRNADTVTKKMPAYREFAEAEAAWLESNEALKAENFWYERVISRAGSKANTVHSNKVLPVNCNGRLAVSLNYNTIAALKQTVKNSAGTFEILLSAYQLILANISRQDDIMIGTPYLNRPAGFRKVAGYFANPLAIKSNINYNLTFTEHLRGNLAFIKERKKYARFPFSSASAGSNREYFSYFFSIHNRFFDIPPQPAGKENTGDQFCYSVLDILQKTDSRYTLHLEVFERRPLANAIFHYNTSVLSEKDAVQISERFCRLLDLIAANPDKTVGNLLLSLPEETGFTKKIGRAPFRQYETRTGYSEQFDYQAGKHANATAVSDSEGKWSYAELAEYADTIAVNLTAYFDAAPGQKKGKKIIAVAIERSRELAAFAIGIWKAGYVFMPADPLLPPAVLQYMLEDADACLFITEKTVPGLAVSQVLQTRFLNRNRKKAGEMMLPAGTGFDGAYIMYTSQTPGNFRGALISQQGMLNHICSKIEELQLDETGKVAQTASQSADTCIWQMFAPLLCGASVRIYSSSEIIMADAHVQQIEQDAITVMQVLPEAFAAFALSAVNQKPAFSQLKYLVTTGEEKKESGLFEWLRHYTHIRIINCYTSAGITGKTEPEQYTDIHTDRAAANTQMYLVDEYGRLYTAGNRDGVPDTAFDHLYNGNEAGEADPWINTLQDTVYNSNIPLPVMFSSWTPEGLNLHIENMITFIAKNQSLAFADLCYTLGRERIHYGFRKSFVADSKESLLNQMSEFLYKKDSPAAAVTTAAKPVLIFSRANALIYPTIELWCRYDPFFEERYQYYLERITFGMERTAPSIFRFVFQLAYYDLIKQNGITATQLACMESGCLAAAVTENRITLEEAAMQIEFENIRLLTVAEMNTIVEKLIATHCRGQKPVFIDMGLDSWITGVLKKHPQNGISFIVFDRIVNSPAYTIASMQCLLYDNNIENPARFFDSMNGQSAELPLRTYTKMQYWKKYESGKRKNYGGM